VQGITIVGPLPEAIQSYIEYGIAVSATTTRKDAAQKFVALVAGPTGAETMRAKGMLPQQ
jgi:ABC-type molybdate transport system substrate-binding protein